MRKIGKTARIILIAIICLFAVFPFFWMLSTSFKIPQEVYSFPPKFIPQEATLSGYAEVRSAKIYGKRYDCRFRKTMITTLQINNIDFN